MTVLQNDLTIDSRELVGAFAEHCAWQALDSLAVGTGPNRLYRASGADYPANFSRDSFVYADLSQDMDALRAQVAFSAKHQGWEANPWNGMEPGKIHHEINEETGDVLFNERSTSYNACDTTALFLSGIATLANAGDRDVLDKYRTQIDNAVAYIKRHVRHGLFYEDPAFSKTDRYGLRVTYWKDSVLNNPNRVEPVYPVVFTVAHFENAEALRRIGEVTSDPELILEADKMTYAGIQELWMGDHFVTAIDKEGVIDPPSTDTLMALRYIDPEFLRPGDAEAVEAHMRVLETDAGYVCGIKVGNSSDEYHTRPVWVHEQALLHQAARRHGQERAMEVTERVVPYIPAEQGLFPELLDPLNNFRQLGNNDRQLWAIGAYLYFLRYFAEHEYGD